MMQLAQDLHKTLAEIGEMPSAEFEQWRAFYNVQGLYRRAAERAKGKLKFESWAREQLEEEASNGYLQTYTSAYR